MSDISLSAAVDTSQVATGMATIRNEVQRTAQAAETAFAGMFSPAAILTAALTGGLKEIIDSARKVHEEATRFGLDAEQLQLITNAAQESGLSLQQVAQAMNQLQINSQKALDPSTKQALAMENLGISAREFASLNMQDKILVLADAYADSADRGAAYADVAELIGRRNTELIPILAQGSAAIRKQGEEMGIMGDKTVEVLARASKSFEVFWNQLKVGVATSINKLQDFEDMMERIAQRAHNFIFGLPPGTGLGGGAPVAPVAPAAPSNLGDGSTPIGAGDISAGGSGGGSGGGGLPQWLRTKLAGLAIDQKINELLIQRQFLENALNDPEEQQNEHAASQANLKKQISAIDQALAPLEKQLAEEELRGVQAADLKIQKSQERVALDQFELEIRDALNRGDEYGAFLLQNQSNILRINLDYDEKIQKALDDANVAREHGLQLTAEENDLLAQQLESEKQATLDLEQQRQEQERQRISQGPNPLTINALAEGNLRLGATSDVYAAALAASRGIKPGTPEYNRLLQQITAQDELRNLQGRNLGWEEQLDRDKLVQWFAGTQQQKATANAAKSHQAEIDYWSAIASGHMPSGSNPFLSFFGIPNFTTGLFSPLGAGPGPSGPDKLQMQIDLLQQQLGALQQLVKNTTLVQI